MLKRFAHAVIGMIWVMILVGCAEPPISVAPKPDALQFSWHWKNFTYYYIDAQGRVIDLDSERSISTSEGQAYGMFFALLADDPETFGKLLRWAENNLADGNLTDQLPAWLWGRSDENNWEVLDSNSAIDADIWMAYSLLEAGERWEEPRYTALGRRLAARIIDEGTYQSEHGLTLLPAPYGFTGSDEEYLIVNPSYFSLSLFIGLANHTSDSRWREVFDTSMMILNNYQTHEMGREGFLPDWLAINLALEPMTPEQVEIHQNVNVREGSYDAIRIYLWLAQEAQRDPENTVLHDYKGMLNSIAAAGYPPRKVLWSANDISALQHQGRGPIGFSAVLLPYLAALGDNELLQAQKDRIVAQDHATYKRNYYDHMLLMFGLATLDCFQFSATGGLEFNAGAMNGC